EIRQALDPTEDDSARIQPQTHRRATASAFRARTLRFHSSPFRLGLSPTAFRARETQQPFRQIIDPCRLMIRILNLSCAHGTATATQARLSLRRCGVENPAMAAVDKTWQLDAFLSGNSGPSLRGRARIMRNSSSRPERGRRIPRLPTR